MNRPNSAASARSARPRTGGSGASDKRAGPAGAGAKKGAKAAAPFGSDDEDGDEGGANGSGGPGQVKGKAANNGPSDFVKKLFKCVSLSPLGPSFVRCSSGQRPASRETRADQRFA